MTSERRWLAGLDDIRAVTLECKTCKARLSLAPDEIRTERVRSCPSCNRNWLVAEWSDARSLVSDVLRLLIAIGPASRTQRSGADTEVGVRVLFEFEEPKSGGA